jgi:hypothetical protein
MQMKVVAICFKPYLKQEEACIFLNIESTQLRKLTTDLQVFKTNGGYCKREDLEKIAEGYQGYAVTNAAKRLLLKIKN